MLDRLFNLTVCIGIVLCFFTACVTQTQRVDDAGQPRDSGGLPVEVLRVPQQMQDLSGDLLRYHAKHRTLPASIQTLVQERVMSADRYADLPAYLYDPAGLGTLSDGRQVILVDSEVRIEAHAWCIVREPDGQPRSITLNVTPIALTELEAAARRGQ